MACIFCYQVFARSPLFLIGRPQTLLGGHSDEERCLLPLSRADNAILTVLLCIAGISCSVTLSSRKRGLSICFKQYKLKQNLYGQLLFREQQQQKGIFVLGGLEIRWFVVTFNN